MKKIISVLVIILLLLANLTFTYADNIDNYIDDLKEQNTNTSIGVDTEDAIDSEKSISEFLTITDEISNNNAEMSDSNDEINKNKNYEDEKEVDDIENDNKDSSQLDDEFIYLSTESVTITVDDTNYATVSEIHDNTFGLSGYHFYVIWYDGTSKQYLQVDESYTFNDIRNVVTETARNGQKYVSYYPIPYTGTFDLTQAINDYDYSIALHDGGTDLVNLFDDWKYNGATQDVVYGALYPKMWSVSYDANFPSDGITWSPIDTYISDNFNWATDMSDSSALLDGFSNSKYFFNWDGSTEDAGLILKGSKRYMISGTDTVSGEIKFKRLTGFATASNLVKNSDYKINSRVIFLRNTMLPDWDTTARSIRLYGIWEDYIPYTYYVVYKNGTNIEYKKIESYEDPALFANAMTAAGTGYNGWYLMQDGGVVDETNFDTTYDPDHAIEITSNADLETNFTNWQNSGEATKNVVFGASYAPIPDPAPSRRGGGGGGGGGTGGGDLGKIPDLLNKHNNIPQTDLNSSELLKNVLYPYNGNGHHPFYNVTDTLSYKGFGTWQRWPNSDMWFFHCGDPKSNLAANGYVHSGWYYIGLGSNYGWYHFNNIGIMDTGWYQEGKNTFYLNADPKDANYGKMMTGTQLVEGVYRDFGTNGILVGTK